MIEFRDFAFGSASARTEREVTPYLLLEGYYDLDDHTRQLLEGPKFIVLGYKGSGKSAVSERLLLIQDSRRDLYVRQIDLEEFPFGTLEKIVGGALDPEAKYPLAWSWLVLLTLLDSFLSDYQLASTSDQDLNQVVGILRQVGLLPAVRIKDLAHESVKGSVRAGVPRLLETSLERTAQAQDPWPQVAALLKRLVVGLRTDGQHVLTKENESSWIFEPRLTCSNTPPTSPESRFLLGIIDGLDAVLTRKDVSLASLSALLNELVRMNADFAREGTPARVLLLCRTDLYDRLPNPNKNTIRRDKAILLDWYQEGLAAKRTHLLRLVGRRARIAGYQGDDVLADYLPPEVDRHSTKERLLDYTRHTPRDLIAALNDLQRFSSTERLSQEKFHRGVRRYATDYFYNEIHDGLTGLLEDEERTSVLQLLGSLRERQFTIAKLRSKVRSNRSWADLDIDRLTRALVRVQRYRKRAAPRRVHHPSNLQIPAARPVHPRSPGPPTRRPAWSPPAPSDPGCVTSPSTHRRWATRPLRHLPGLDPLHRRRAAGRPGRRAGGHARRRKGRSLFRLVPPWPRRPRPLGNLPPDRAAAAAGARVARQ
jgi:hypothetical protein